jgi:hypothetical protein
VRLELKAYLYLNHYKATCNYIPFLQILSSPNLVITTVITCVLWSSNNIGLLCFGAEATLTMAGLVAANNLYTDRVMSVMSAVVTWHK